MKPRRRLRLGLLAGALVLVAAGIVGATLAVADINCPTGANGLCEGGSGDNHFNGTDNHD